MIESVAQALLFESELLFRLQECRHCGEVLIFNSYCSYCTELMNWHYGFGD